MAFDLLMIEKIKEKDLDTAIKSTSENGTVVTRLPYTKIRKQFTITPTKVSTYEEMNEVYSLFEVVRTVSPFTFTHPSKKDVDNNPVQYTVRFKDNIEIDEDANYAGFYIVNDFVLEEV